jgi:kinesin family member 6/9
VLPVVQVKDLREEIKMLRGEDQDPGPLTEEALAKLQQMVEAYCSDPDPDAAINLGPSMAKIRAGAFGAHQ